MIPDLAVTASTSCPIEKGLPTYLDGHVIASRKTVFNVEKALGTGLQMDLVAQCSLVRFVYLMLPST